MIKKSKLPLIEAWDERSFWVSDGTVLHNLVDLKNAFKLMSVETFGHHVGKEKNDFASWVQEVLGDSKLAAEMRKSKTKDSQMKKVTDRLKDYQV